VWLWIGAHREKPCDGDWSHQPLKPILEGALKLKAFDLASNEIICIHIRVGGFAPCKRHSNVCSS